MSEQEVWDKSLRAMAAQKLLLRANEWLADNDKADRDPEKPHHRGGVRPAHPAY